MNSISNLSNDWNISLCLISLKLWIISLVERRKFGSYYIFCVKCILQFCMYKQLFFHFRSNSLNCNCMSHFNWRLWNSFTWSWVSIFLQPIKYVLYYVNNQNFEFEEFYHFLWIWNFHAFLIYHINFASIVSIKSFPFLIHASKFENIC
jgi:hypothetical protein